MRVYFRPISLSTLAGVIVAIFSGLLVGSYGHGWHGGFLGLWLPTGLSCVATGLVSVVFEPRRREESQAELRQALGRELDRLGWDTLDRHKPPYDQGSQDLQ